MRESTTEEHPECLRVAFSEGVIYAAENEGGA
jgi:hypothetical protein